MSDSKNQVHFRRIGWKDTWAVIELSHSLLPRELCRKTHSLLALFVNFERQNTNLSFGLFAGDKMVGYMLVYFLDRSLYHDRAERIVHIDEYCVMPEYRGRGRDVISRMVHESELFQKRSGIEAIATGGALEHWLSIGRVVTRWGYETNLRENDCERAGHKMGRIRWEFKPDESWRPETPMKLPKAVLAQEVNGQVYELLVVRNTRQWLSLAPAYSEIAGKAGADWFAYSWQWWRHFGISEELRVLALQLNGQTLCIVPLSAKPACDNKEGSAISSIGQNSAYYESPVICADEKRSENRAVLQKIATQHADLLGEQLAPAIDGAFEVVSGQPSVVKEHKPFDWFGLNRRTSELHKNFVKCLAVSN